MNDRILHDLKESHLKIKILIEMIADNSSEEYTQSDPYKKICEEAQAIINLCHERKD